MDLRTLKSVENFWVTLLYVSSAINASMTRTHSPAHHCKSKLLHICGSQLPVSVDSVFQSSRCRICSENNSPGIGFSPSAEVFPVSVTSPLLPCHVYYPEMDNGPISCHASQQRIITQRERRYCVRAILHIHNWLERNFCVLITSVLKN
jgi:hypothetical protein